MTIIKSRLTGDAPRDSDWRERIAVAGETVLTEAAAVVVRFGNGKADVVSRVYRLSDYSEYAKLRSVAWAQAKRLSKQNTAANCYVVVRYAGERYDNIGVYSAPDHILVDRARLTEPVDRYVSVWVANRFNETDGLYVFADEHRAQEFAARYQDCAVTEEPIMNDSAAAQFLIEETDSAETIEYRVTWEIDIDARSPIEAARKAQAMQRDPSALVGTFSVDGERVDLDGIGPMPGDARDLKPRRWQESCIED